MFAFIKKHQLSIIITTTTIISALQISNNTDMQNFWIAITVLQSILLGSILTSNKK